MGKFLLWVVPVGLAAGILLPYAVLNSDEIAARFHKGPVSLAPEIQIDRQEVRDQALVMPKRVARPASMAVEIKPEGRWYRKNGRTYYRTKRGSRRRRSLDAHTRKRLQQADQDAWKAADRYLQAERQGMM